MRRASSLIVIVLLAMIPERGAVHAGRWQVSRAQLAGGRLVPGRFATGRRSMRLRDGRQVDVMVKVPRWFTRRSEAAAFALSDAAGFHLVPPTFERRGKGGRRTIQLWVRGTQLPGHAASPYLAPVDHEQLLTMHLFDYLITHKDRHGLNWLVRAATRRRTSRLVAIDNDESYFMPALTPYAEYSSKLELRDRVPTENHRLFFERIDERRVVRALRGAGLPDRNILGVLLRIENIRSTFPSAASGRAATPDGVLARGVRARLRRLMADSR